MASTRLLPSALLFLFPLVVLLASSNITTCLVQAQPLLPANLTVLSAAGDGSCVSVGGVALNCTFPFTLNLTVVHLPDPTSWYISNLLGLTLKPPNSSAYAYGYAPFQASVYGGTFTPTLISVSVFSTRFALPAQTLLGLSLSWVTEGNGTREQSQWGPFPTFSLQPWVYPTVYSVAGCQATADALVMLGCVPEQDAFTNTGSGFAQLSSANLVVSGANVTTISRALYFSFTAG